MSLLNYSIGKNIWIIPKWIPFFILGILSLHLRGQPGFQVGVFVLPGTTNLYNENDVNLPSEVFQLEWLGGMAVGISGQYQRIIPSTNLHAGIKVNAIYSQQGGAFSFLNGVGERVEEVTRLEYVKFPVMLGVQLPSENRKWIFSVYSGIQASILAQAFRFDDNTEFVPPIPENITGFPTTFEAFEAWDLSAILELGWDVRLAERLYMNLKLRVDASVRDAEDKNVTFFITEAGMTDEVNFWQSIRGENRDAVTRNLTAGLLIGLSYHLSSP